MKHAPKLHIWAAIGSYAKTKLFLFQESMDSDLYTKILRKNLKETRLLYAPDTPKNLRKKWKFLQDNSSVHKSRKSMAVVEELVGDRLIVHPPLSPDLNVIEDMWSYLDRKVKEARVTSICQLKRVLNKSGRTYLGLR